MVLIRFSFDQFRVGAGDQWVFAGGLAISALAAGNLAPAAVAVSSDADWLRPIGEILVWPAAVVCLILLVGSGRHLTAEARPAST